MVCSFTKTDSIAGFVTAIYDKGLNLIRTDSNTDPVTAIYSIGLTLYKNKLCLNLQLKADSVTHTSSLTFLVKAYNFTKNNPITDSLTDISSRGLKLYQQQTAAKTLS